MQPRTLLGVLTPSSNTILEPLTAQILSSMTNVSAHFGRLRVTEISMSEHALAQFDMEPFLNAAELLADARVEVILWSGTSAGWRGFDTDKEICAAIKRKTGIVATSSVLAMNDAFERKGVKKLGLVTPYLSEVQQQIIANYQALGVEIVAERHLQDRGNFSFSEFSEGTIEGLIRDVVAEGSCDAVAVYCTNMQGARLAAGLEQELGVPIYDSVSTGVWQALLLAGKDPADVKGWGGLFELR